MGTTVMVKLTKIWKNKSLSTVTKLRVIKTLVWPVMSYGCKAWTLKLEEEKRIQAFENECIKNLLRIPWTKLMTTEQNKMAGTEGDLLSHIKSRKLRYFGHIMRLPHDNIEGSVMTGLVEGTSRGAGRVSGQGGQNLAQSAEKKFSFAHPGFQFAHPAIRNGCPPCPPHRGGFKGKGLVGH